MEVSHDKERISQFNKQAAEIAESLGLKGNLFTDYQDENLNVQFQIKLTSEQIIAALAMLDKIFNKQKTLILPDYYFPCVKVGALISKRGDVIAKGLKRQELPVIQKNRKNYCDPKHVALLYSDLPEEKKSLLRKLGREKKD